MRDDKRFNWRLKDAFLKEKTLVAAHRGTCGGNIIENTIGAYLVALASRADIVEMDIVESADGELFMFHDTNEKRLLGADKNIKTMSSGEILSYRYINQGGEVVGERVNRADDVFKALKGKCLINVDRCWNFWDKVVQLVGEHDMFDQVIFKSAAEEEYLSFLEALPEPVMYMPKALSSEDMFSCMERDINIVAFETIFTTVDNDVLDPAVQKRVKDQGVHLWANSLRLNDEWDRSAGHDDNRALLGDREGNWGWLIDHGFDIIQTDWPLHVKTFIDSRK